MIEEEYIRQNAISGGFRPATTKIDHKTRKFGGGAKTPFIHPPVAQNTQVNSGDWHLYSV
ncbi:MAG: hypothetical protein V7L04_26235 [Nostoc sp.]